MFKLQMEFPKDKVDKLPCVEKQKVEEIPKSVELDTSHARNLTQTVDKIPFYYITVITMFIKDRLITTGVS